MQKVCTRHHTQTCAVIDVCVEQDKWRNLNMEARDKDQAKSLDDDPDFHV